ncbi:MAG: argininosuccinate lyase [Deltaproteobacteria bacterium]|nr:argininosuccinate lyase [Deltaproteobacteria bacterium]
MAKKLWDGRFSESTDKLVEAFTSSIDVDKRLYAYDVEGSIAHCRVLARAAVISQREAKVLVRGLEKIKKDIKQGHFEFSDSLEDIHMHIETRLAQVVGKTAEKLHTARSRNDQVALDIRMFLRDETRNIIRRLIELRQVILELAKRNIDTILPGYTHMQRAQPVLLSHHFMAYFEMLSRDAQRFKDSLKRIDVMPLGSAALAGTPYPIDRNYSAKLLGFSKVSENSIDAVSDRDFVIEFLSAASLCMVHLSRLSEELILWSSSEFGFIELPDAFATGSSIMPQKKNPDVPELVRGKSGKVFGNLMTLLTLMKSLPLAYNRDMQEDKQPLFEAADILNSCLQIYTKMLPRLIIKKHAMYQATLSGYLNATDLADYLVSRGMSFRQAHSCAGRIVEYANSKGKEIHELSLKELQVHTTLIQDDIYTALTPEEVVNRRTSAGGTARKNVISAMAKARKKLSRERTAFLRAKEAVSMR